MQSPPCGTTGSSRLPDLLAEYGRLAARLPGATEEEGERLHRRLAELDVIIDNEVAAAESQQE